ASLPLRRVVLPAGFLLCLRPRAVLVRRHESEAVLDVLPAVLAAVARLRRHPPGEHQDQANRRPRQGSEELPLGHPCQRHREPGVGPHTNLPWPSPPDRVSAAWRFFSPPACLQSNRKFSAIARSHVDEYTIVAREATKTRRGKNV